MVNNHYFQCWIGYRSEKLWENLEVTHGDLDPSVGGKWKTIKGEPVAIELSSCVPFSTLLSPEWLPWPYLGPKK